MLTRSVTEHDGDAQPSTIDVDRAVGIRLGWPDGLEIEIDLVSLRLSCPCAECRGLRQRDADTWPRPGSPIPLAITDASLHGAWGLSLIWNDGHSAGIFPFDQLRRRAEQAGPGD